MKYTKLHKTQKVGYSNLTRLDIEARKRDNNRCVNCGRADKRLEVHHIVPLPTGKDILSNLITLCQSCHVAAHGYKTQYQQHYSTQYLLDEIRRVSQLVKEPLSRRIFEKYSKISETCLRKRFGSWSNAKKLANIR